MFGLSRVLSPAGGVFSPPSPAFARAGSNLPPSRGKGVIVSPHPNPLPRGEGAFAPPCPAPLDSRLRGNDELECRGLFIFHFTLIFMLALRWFDRLTTNGMGGLQAHHERNGGRLR